PPPEISAPSTPPSLPPDRGSPRAARGRWPLSCPASGSPAWTCRRSAAPRQQRSAARRSSPSSQGLADHPEGLEAHLIRSGPRGVDEHRIRRRHERVDPGVTQVPLGLALGQLGLPLTLSV